MHTVKEPTPTKEQEEAAIKANWRKYLKDLRHDLRMTQADLAQELCISRRTVNNWETGKVIPDTIVNFALLYLKNKKKEKANV